MKITSKNHGRGTRARVLFDAAGDTLAPVVVTMTQAYGKPVTYGLGIVSNEAGADVTIELSAEEADLVARHLAKLLGYGNIQKLEKR